MMDRQLELRPSNWGQKELVQSKIFKRLVSVFQVKFLLYLQFINVCLYWSHWDGTQGAGSQVQGENFQRNVLSLYFQQALGGCPAGTTRNTAWEPLISVCCFPNLYRSCSACKFRTCSWENKEGRERPLLSYVVGFLVPDTHALWTWGVLEDIIHHSSTPGESRINCRSATRKVDLEPSPFCQPTPCRGCWQSLVETNSHLAVMASCKSASSGQIY